MNNTHLQVPFLSSLDRISFFRFLDAYDLYVAQATALNLAIPPRITFISPTVARIIGIRVDLNELDDADIFGRITDEFFRFNTQIEAHRALERLHLHTKTPMALLQHIAAFQRNLELCDDDTRPSAAQQRKLFVRSLPPLLQSRVKLMEPGSFDDACNHAITELDELIAAREQLGLQDNHATSAERATAAPAALRERPTAPHHGPVKCHGCGHEGHMRPNCPNSRHPHFFTTGMRRNPIRLTPIKAEAKKIGSRDIVSRDVVSRDIVSPDLVEPHSDTVHSDTTDAIAPPRVEATISDDNPISTVLLDTGATHNFVDLCRMAAENGEIHLP
ncbi:Zinc finger CCHC-type [Carpediemonas membranifera]|uniref:Zinc finger CCHC-type n=1 Tax=Carpediemonas membranifera TaxID=201153 RepID=A0A8J6AQQ0_9EUKA|nr:Zinc finger CCHC-type [Carpediemonas membranifera]|eukprot:KAG9389630.1 Zinc finger CCHC-type [Carpediemonas membranifera]